MRVPNEWLFFEIGARVLVHYHHAQVWSTPPLHLYADNPHIQIGPPPLLAVAAFQSFPPRVVAAGFGIVMLLAAVLAIAALESCARAVAPRKNQQQVVAAVLMTELVLVAAWAHEDGYWHHLDDALALACICVSLWLCAKDRPWWLVALLAGTAVACKPWAVVALPFLLCFPRAQRAKVVLVAIGAAVIWWLPFVLAAPRTIHALSAYRIYPDAGSVPALLGFHGDVAAWLRPTQLCAGLAVAAVVAVRGDWLAAPLAGFATRVFFDPFVFSYYSIGPLLGAFIYDFSRGRRVVPTWTIATFALEYGLSAVAPPEVAAGGRLAWSVTTVGVLLIRRSAERSLRPTAVTPRY